MFNKILSDNSNIKYIKKILVVEDHRSIREIFVASLYDESSDIVVLQAANSEQAREIFANNPDIQMVVMDYNLNGDSSTGADLTREMLAQNAKLYIVANSCDEDLNRELIASGCRITTENKSPLDLIKKMSEKNLFLENTQ